MEIITIMVWIIVALLGSTAIYIWVVPYISNKVMLYTVALKLKKMSKKDPAMQELADLAKQVAKDYKIDDEL